VESRTRSRRGRHGNNATGNRKTVSRGRAGQAVTTEPMGGQASKRRSMVEAELLVGSTQIHASCVTESVVQVRVLAVAF
jgi:hypothetical protein